MTHNPRNLLSGIVIRFLLLVSFFALAPSTGSAAPDKPQVKNAQALIHRIAPTKPGHTLLTDAVYHDQIVVKFREGTRIRLRNKVLKALNGKNLAQLHDMLDKHGRPRVSRLFSRSEAGLDDDKTRGEARTHQQLADLNLYYMVQPPSGASEQDVESLIDDLNAMDIVEIAYPEPKAEPAAADIPPTTPDFEADQGHLNSAPQGVDAHYGWTLPGGQGLGTRFIDVEYGWRSTHEDLKAPFFAAGNFSSGTLSGNSSNDNHGTAVLGEILGDANGFGITGIAPQAEYGVSSATQGVAQAINTAAAQLSPGDVILIELHMKGPASGQTCTCNCGQFEFVPMEYTQADFDAIKAATANGIVVVEAGGNGSMDLDSAIYKGMFDRNVRDSGAILVGAGNSTNHGPTCWTNYGTRIDVQGWGNNVYTTGYGNLFKGDTSAPDPNQYYTATFSGTSSASPIIVGSVLAMEGYRKQNYGTVIAPEQMRLLLSMLGTPQASSPKHIGPLPDIHAMADRMGVDSDLDGLTDQQEVQFGTDIHQVDTDHDGVSDYREVCYDGDCSTYNPAPGGGDMNALDPDTDHDGLTDGDELLLYGSSPVAIDGDGDGLSDFDEVHVYGTNPGKSDSDGDGLNDQEEIVQYHTDPLNADSDGDLLNDYDEVITYHTDPNNPDSDGDGFTDGQEVQAGMDPLQYDGEAHPWLGTVTGRVTTPDGRGLAGVTFWDVTKYPQTVTTDANGYFVQRGYTSGQTVYFNTFGVPGYTLTPSGWSGAPFAHSGGAEVARNFIATQNTGTVSGRVTKDDGSALAGATFWDVVKYPLTFTTAADGSFIQTGYQAGQTAYFNYFVVSGYSLTPSGWSGAPFIHDGSAMTGKDFVATQKTGTVSGRITSPDGKGISGLTFWDVQRYPQTVTTASDGSFILTGYNAGDNVLFNTNGISGYMVTPSGWNGQSFTHDGSAIKHRDYVAVPNGSTTWLGTVTGRVTTPDGRGLAGVTFWDVTKYPQTVTTDANGYFVQSGYTSGQTVYFNTFVVPGYTLTPSGWSGAPFTYSGSAEVARNFIATQNTGTVSGRVTKDDGSALAGATFWDVVKYPLTFTTAADGSFIQTGYQAGQTAYFNYFVVSGYSLTPSGWSGAPFIHDGSAMTGKDFVATQKTGTVSGRITSPDGKGISGITLWDVTKYPQTVTTASDGSFTITGYQGGENVLLNTNGATDYDITPSGWDGQTFVHDGSAITKRDFIAVHK